MISIVCAQRRWLCGCAKWLEWDEDCAAWIGRSFTCGKHEAECA